MSCFFKPEGATHADRVVGMVSGRAHGSLSRVGSSRSRTFPEKIKGLGSKAG